MGIDARVLIRVPRAVPDEEIKWLGNRLCDLFSHDRFFFWEEDDGTRHHFLRREEEYEQDGDSIFSQPGETLINVRVWTRYYGVGYERGDFPFLYMLASAIEGLVPGCAVWYGGNSSGVLAEPFGHEQREALFAHWVKSGSRPYRSFFNRKREGLNPLCTLCDVEMVQCGSGGGYASFNCECGEQVKIYNGNEKRTTPHQRSMNRGKLERAAMQEYMERHPEVAKSRMPFDDLD